MEMSMAQGLLNYLVEYIPIEVLIRLSGRKMILPFYHTVTDAPAPHIASLGYYRSVGEFEADLRFLKSHYESIAIERISEAKHQCFHISFDDGLAETYSIAHTLYDHKVDATFFVNTAFVDNLDMFFRHKVSVILDQISNSQSQAALLSDFIQLESGTLNSYLKRIADIELIDQMASVLGIDFRQYLADHRPYVTTKQLREMQAMGYVIASHSHSHPNFAFIPYQTQQMQISESIQWLRQNLNINNFYFSFPFGDHLIAREFYDYLYTTGQIKYSFGVSGLQLDSIARHHHRIAMEYQGYTASQIIKYQYAYYCIKALLGKHRIEHHEHSVVK